MSGTESKEWWLNQLLMHRCLVPLETLFGIWTSHLQLANVTQSMEFRQIFRRGIVNVCFKLSLAALQALLSALTKSPLTYSVISFPQRYLYLDIHDLELAHMPTNSMKCHLKCPNQSSLAPTSGSRGEYLAEVLHPICQSYVNISKTKRWFMALKSNPFCTMRKSALHHVHNETTAICTWHQVKLNSFISDTCHCSSWGWARTQNGSEVGGLHTFVGARQWWNVAAPLKGVRLQGLV